MAERWTTLEWDKQFPHTDDPKEIERRHRLFDERNIQLDLVETGLCCWYIKHCSTKEGHYKTAATYKEAVEALGWHVSECRGIPIEVGKEKKPMPEEVKQILRDKNEEKKREREEKKGKDMSEEKTTPKEKKEKGPSLKSEMEALFAANSGADKDTMLPKIFELLKSRNTDKDDAHLKKRSVLCYHFYKKKDPK